MSKPKWSDWIDWHATADSVCPLEDGVLSQVQLRNGSRMYENITPEGWTWSSRGIVSITAYRYELPEEPTKADEWIKCSEQTPNLGQRVILQSKGVIQNYMPLFDQGDNDFGMGEHFWEFEDVNEADNPLVDFEKDCWMPRPEPLKQEGT